MTFKEAVNEYLESDDRIILEKVITDHELERVQQENEYKQYIDTNCSRGNHIYTENTYSTWDGWTRIQHVKCKNCGKEGYFRTIKCDDMAECDIHWE